MERWWAMVAVAVAAGGMLAGCSAYADEEQGVWCMEDTARIEVLFLDGYRTYSVQEKDDTDTVTTTVDGEAYEMLEEDGGLYWHSWMGDAEYTNEVTTLTAGEQLILDGTMEYWFLADHDLEYDVASIDECILD